MKGSIRSKWTWSPPFPSCILFPIISLQVYTTMERTHDYTNIKSNERSKWTCWSSHKNISLKSSAITEDTKQNYSFDWKRKPSYWFLACLRQKTFILPRPSLRDDGSMANATRSQFFSPTATPAKARMLQMRISKIDWKCPLKWLDHFLLPGSTTTDSSFASFTQKSISSSMSSSSDRFNLT